LSYFFPALLSFRISWFPPVFFVPSPPFLPCPWLFFFVLLPFFFPCILLRAQACLCEVRTWLTLFLFAARFARLVVFQLFFLSITRDSSVFVTTASVSPFVCFPRRGAFYPTTGPIRFSQGPFLVGLLFGYPIFPDFKPYFMLFSVFLTRFPPPPPSSVCRLSTVPAMPPPLGNPYFGCPIPLHVFN